MNDEICIINRTVRSKELFEVFFCKIGDLSEKEFLKLFTLKAYSWYVMLYDPIRIRNIV